jgi:putative transposase
LRIKPRKRLVREKHEAMTVPQGISQVWSMDFMQDQLEDRRTFRLLVVIKDFDREAIGMEIDFSLPSERVIWELGQIISWREMPQVIRCDNGPEYISSAIKSWAAEMTDLIWPRPDLHQSSDRPWLLNIFTSTSIGKRGD